MNKNPSVKILVGYHKPAYLLEGECFVPVWGGKDIAKQSSKDGPGLSEQELEWMNKNCLGDNTGDNISSKNRNYSEASVLYWMWKNYNKIGNPDYIGFLQYRRHWIFNKKYLSEHQPNFWNLVVEEYFSKDHQQKIGLTQENIFDVLVDCDGVFCTNDTGKTIQAYKENHHSQDVKYWNRALEIIKKDWPQFVAAAQEYNQGTWHAWSNCFIMRREDFLEYCPFLFDVLQKIDAEAADEYDYMTSEQMRVPAYVSETMLGIFWTYLKNKGRHFKSFPLLLISQPFLSPCCLPCHIAPIYKESINIVFSADKNYIPYLSVAVQSIIDCSSTRYNYDIIILYTDIIEYQKRFLLSMLKDFPNISIRFFNMNGYIDKYDLDKLFTERYLSLSAYFRLFMGKIFEAYKKVIYLDCDLIVTRDIAELFEINIGHHAIGAAYDLGFTNKLYNEDYTCSFKKYLLEKFNFSHLEKYFNSGVLLVNIEEFNKVNLEYLLDLAQRNNQFFHDQNVLNVAFENNYFRLPQTWNLQWHIKFQCSNYQKKLIKEESALYDDFQYVPAIIHYTSNEKPWKYPHHSFANIWWQYARISPFYEIILKNLTSENSSQPIVTKSIFLQILSHKKDKVRYWRYKILSKITFGKMRKKYKQKKKEMKEKLKQIKNFIKK